MKWPKVGNQDTRQRRTDDQHPHLGKPATCSPASTGTRWTTRDGSPSLRSSARSSTAGPSSRAGSTRAWRSTRRPAGTRSPTKVATLPITDAGARLFQRFIFAGAVESTLDGQGRVLVPAYLREMAGLEAEAVVVGSRDHAEIWAPARWDDYRRALEDPDALAAGPRQGLGI